jgi:hypothetical protein
MKLLCLISLFLTSMYSFGQSLTNWKWGEEKLIYDLKKKVYIVVIRSIEDDDMISLNVDSVTRLKDRVHVFAKLMPANSSDLLSTKVFLGRKAKTDSLWGYKALLSLKYNYDISKKEYIIDCPNKTPLYLLLQSKSRYTCVKIELIED